MLTISNLSFRYKKRNRYILKDLSMELEQGKIGIILGKNGAGKTTLIKNILGIEKPESGRILFDDMDFVKLPRRDKAKLVAYVPQTIDFGCLSVLETVMTGRIPYFGYRTSDQDMSIAMDIIKKLGILEYVYRNADELSGGERQKVAIARALAQSPKLMIFDEPTASLDIGNEQIIVKEMIRLSKNMNVSILTSIHDINQALALGDVFFLMKEGNIKYTVTKDAITEEMLRDIYDADIRILNIKSANESGTKKIVLGGYL
ncbi:ABC transporter ATP-binding protein [Butyrivibrio fibrisolvens]|uniref:ABC transporter ATP-binding protein n=1 Tax=Butyrivibrio fibrisolvens TaxID=831 RepID=UPI0003B3184C|nr:ABC transporter ATP-binding protein [Butyrivibrio fibrisolvens]